MQWSEYSEPSCAASAKRPIAVVPRVLTAPQKQSFVNLDTNVRVRPIAVIRPMWDRLRMKTTTLPYALYSLAVAVALWVLLARVGSWSNGADMLLWYGWVAGPIVAAFFVAVLRPAALRMMWVYSVTATALGAWVYYNAFVASEQSTSGLIMIFMPLVQWIAVLLCAVVAFARQRQSAKAPI
jgi:hypothetical protein